MSDQEQQNIVVDDEKSDRNVEMNNQNASEKEPEVAVTSDDDNEERDAMVQEETVDLIAAGDKMGEKCPCLWFYMYRMMNGNISIRMINYSMMFLLFFTFVMGHHLSQAQYSVSNVKYCKERPHPLDLPMFQIKNCDYVQLLADAYVILFSADVIGAIVAFATTLVFLFSETDDDPVNVIIRFSVGGFLIITGILYLCGTATQLAAIGYLWPAYPEMQSHFCMVVGEMLLIVCSLFIIAFQLIFSSVFKVEELRIAVYMVVMFCVFCVMIGGYSALAYHDGKNEVLGEYVTLATGFSIMAFTCLFYFFKTYYVIKSGVANKFVSDAEGKLRLCTSFMWFLGGIVAVAGYIVVAVKVAEKKQLYMMDFTQHVLNMYIDTGLLTMYYIGYMLLVLGLTKVITYDLIMPDQRRQ